MIPFYKYSLREKTYNAYVGDDIYCEECNKGIFYMEPFTVFVNWMDRKEPKYKFMCFTCANSNKKTNKIDWEHFPCTRFKQVSDHFIPQIRKDFQTKEHKTQVTIPLAGTHESNYKKFYERKTQYKGEEIRNDKVKLLLSVQEDNTPQRYGAEAQKEILENGEWIEYKGQIIPKIEAEKLEIEDKNKETTKNGIFNFNNDDGNLKQLDIEDIRKAYKLKYFGQISEQKEKEVNRELTKGEIDKLLDIADKYAILKATGGFFSQYLTLEGVENDRSTGRKGNDREEGNKEEA